MHSRSPIWFPLALIAVANWGCQAPESGEAMVAWDPPAAAHASPPNIVLILCDDLGYADLGFTGCEDIPTPHLDRLAREGVLCTDAHVSASVCAPSRAGLLTGVYQQRGGFEANLGSGEGLLPGTRTFAADLQGAGYQTCLVGKWHLGSKPGSRPDAMGFDHFTGLLGGSRSYFPIDKKTPSKQQRIERDGEVLPEESLGYVTDAFTDEGVRYIEERDPAKPLMLFMSYTAPHSPMHARPDLLERFSSIENPRRAKYAAMVACLDEGVGRLRGALETEGMADNTMIVFLSDNGGATTNASDNGPWRGMKGSKWEGGHRVPFVVHYPGRLAPGQFDGCLSSLDLAPTFAAAAQCVDALPSDGVDLMPFLESKARGPVHGELFWRRAVAAAYRDGDWKLIRIDEKDGTRRPPILVDLASDPGERSDVSGAHPTRVEGMLQKLESWESGLMEPRWMTGEIWRENQRNKHLMSVVTREDERRLP